MTEITIKITKIVEWKEKKIRHLFDCLKMSFLKWNTCYTFPWIIDGFAFGSSTLFNFVLVWLYKYFDLSVTNESYVNGTRAWRKKSITLVPLITITNEGMNFIYDLITGFETQLIKCLWLGFFFCLWRFWCFH